MKQGELFDSQRYNRQGPLSVRQFMEESNWHGTDVENWDNRIKDAAVPVHHGTIDSAGERAGYFAKFHPVRAKEVSEHRVSDREANFADLSYREANDLGYSDTVNDSVENTDEPADTFAIERAHSELTAGRTVPYTNWMEDRGSTSYVSPPGGFETISDADFGLAERTWRPQRTHLTSDDFAAQGLERPSTRRQSRNVYNDPRLIESIEPTRSSDRQWLRGEDVQAMPDEVVAGLDAHRSTGELYGRSTAGGRRGELFAAMRRI